MTVLLVASVTATPTPLEAAELARLLSSLRGQEVAVQLLLAVRGGATCPVSVPLGVRVQPVPVPAGASLSLSRNLALAHARATGLASRADAIGFPDDDCWYPPGALAAVIAAMGEVDVVCGRYGPAPETIDTARFPDRPQPVTVAMVMRSVSSVTMFWRRQALAAVGAFDERLGVGAAFGSSEDVDLVLRARAAGLRLRYCPEVVVCHDYRPARTGAYFCGNCAVLAKHRRSRGVLVLLLRRLLSGALLALAGRLPWRDYLAGWAAVAQVGRRPPVTAGCSDAAGRLPAPAARPSAEPCPSRGT